MPLPDNATIAERLETLAAARPMPTPVRGLGNMRLAVATARRGWASADDVLNTRPVDEIV